jgi:heptosyltransferase-3
MRPKLDRGNAILRTLDQGLGPWLLRGIGAVHRLLFWRRRRRPIHPHAIGVIKAAALGDTILLSAILSDLKKAFPTSRVILFVGSSNAFLARDLKDIDKVVQLPLRNPWVALRLLRREKLDWMIDADSWPRISALWACLAGAKWVLGFRTGQQQRHFAFDQYIQHDGELHELSNYRNLLRALDVPVGSLPQDPRLWLASRPGGLNAAPNPEIALSPTVFFHPWPGGTKSELKEWPLDFWAELAARILADPAWRILLSGAAADCAKNEKLLAVLPVALRGRVHNAAEKALDVSLANLAFAKALVSVNTGILHLGAALRIPVLGLHGATNPKRWGPVGEGHESVVSAHPQAACLNLGFEYPAGDPDIMRELSVDRVMQGWRGLVRKNDLQWKD